MLKLIFLMEGPNLALILGETPVGKRSPTQCS